MKLREAYGRFMKIDRAPATTRTYKKFLPKFIAAIGPDVHLERIQAEVIDDFFHEMRERDVKYKNHPRRPTEDGKLSPATIDKNLKMVRALFNFCVKRGYLERSPAEDVRVRRYRRPAASSKAIDPDDLQRLISAAKINASEWFRLRDHAIMMFLVTTGCRAGGLCSLQLPNLDLARGTARLHEKADNLHTVYFGQKTANALRYWLNIRPHAPHNFVFLSSRGHVPLTPAALGELVKRLAERAGVENNANPHAIRHRVGQAWFDAGLPPTLIRDKLGHSSVNTTLENYGNQDSDRLRAISQEHELLALEEGVRVVQPDDAEDDQAEPKIISFTNYREA